MKWSIKNSKDIFLSYCLKNANFDGYYDIPSIGYFKDAPKRLIEYGQETKYVITDGDFVHFYTDDYKFDGPRGVWQTLVYGLNNKKGFNSSKLARYSGVICPDFSFYLDMPRAQQIWNVYRSRAVGYALSKMGLNVIPNIRWANKETYNFAFSGVEMHSVVSVGTLGCAKNKYDRVVFMNGFREMVKRIEPKYILIYGSVFAELKEFLSKNNIKYFNYISETSKYFRGKSNGI